MQSDPTPKRPTLCRRNAGHGSGELATADARRRGLESEQLADLQGPEVVSPVSGCGPITLGGLTRNCGRMAHWRGM